MRADAAHYSSSVPTAQNCGKLVRGLRDGRFRQPRLGEICHVRLGTFAIRPALRRFKASWSFTHDWKIVRRVARREGRRQE
jgi:hypothetical protein